eukprot:12537597-Alexandrium_andersonii.AAC.1
MTERAMPPAQPGASRRHARETRLGAGVGDHVLTAMTASSAARWCRARRTSKALTGRAADERGALACAVLCYGSAAA